MTDKSENTQGIDAGTGAAASTSPSSALVDIGPVIAYVLTFNIARRGFDVDSTTALYYGAGVMSVAIVFAVLYSLKKFGRVSPMLWISAVVIVGTAAISILFKNPIIFKMKPTAINILFGGAILGSLAMGKNVFKLMMGEAYKLPDSAWRTLAFRWGLFFFALAALNEFIWRNFSTDFWSDFKLWGMLPITFIFTLLNIPLLMKHMDLGQGPAQDSSQEPVKDEKE